MPVHHRRHRRRVPEWVLVALVVSVFLAATLGLALVGFTP